MDSPAEPKHGANRARGWISGAFNPLEDALRRAHRALNAGVTAYDFSRLAPSVALDRGEYINWQDLQDAVAKAQPPDKFADVGKLLFKRVDSLALREATATVGAGSLIVTIIQLIDELRTYLCNVYDIPPA